MRQWDLRNIKDLEPIYSTTLVEEDQGDGTQDPFRVLADQLPLVFWTTDTELRFTSSLGAGLAELGIGPNQVVGSLLFDLLETDERFAPIDAHLLALSGHSVAFEMAWAGHWFRCRVAPLREAAGAEVIGTICVALDDAEDDEVETESPLWQALVTS